MRTPIWGPLGLGLLGIVFLAAGCAYFNTFYLAKKYYREGQKAQERSVTDGVVPEAATKYDMTIRQCQKVLADYGDSKWADDATFLYAAALYGKGDYVGAIRRLEEFQVKFPSSPFLPEARLIRGISHLKRRDYPEADSIFEACDRDYPKLERRAELYFYAGESRAAQREYPRALAWYARAIDDSKTRRMKSDALRRTGDALFASGRVDSAVEVFAQALRSEERPKQRLDIALRRAEGLRDLKRYDEALAFLEDWRPNSIAEKREGELLLRLHDVEARLGRTQEAISGYRSLVQTYPNTPVAADAQFRIGYLYESALSDYDTAAKEYEKLKGGPPSEFQTQANRRSQGLATMKKYRESLLADTTQAKARSAFLLAELYYFQLDKPDSALQQYASVEAEFPQSVYAPKSSYARLWITALDRNDTLAVQSMTDDMAARYKGTRFAESALYFWKSWSGRTDERTALLDTLLAHPDTTGESRFTPEETTPEPSLEATTAATDTSYTAPLPSLETLNARRASILGRAPQQPAPPKPPKKSAAMSPGEAMRAAYLDSLQTAKADSLQTAKADSIRAAQPDSSGSPGPASPPPAEAPADTTKPIYITPQR
ncbi:MAG TPA: tetratricopeptide repeat protein [Candidatus Eisenbacteria bacterium]|nr:tetratricopeptide repeat protein [Candidatus Eisenbacteria bacterium]